MKPHKNKSYGLVEPIFRNVLIFLVGTYLTKMETSVLTSVNKLFAKVIPQISRLLKINWKPIVEPRPKYYDQKEISVERVDMNTALALQCGLDPGQIVRTLGGEYTGEWRDVKKILAAVKSVVSISDYMQIERILTTGCPYEFNFEETSESKLKMIKRGNQKSFNQYPDQVAKLVNKEDII